MYKFIHMFTYIYIKCYDRNIKINDTTNTYEYSVNIKFIYEIPA